jgi:ankyrin repeat protein
MKIFILISTLLFGSVTTQLFAAPLHDAAGRGDVEEIQRILSQGSNVNINAVDENGLTALLLATYRGHAAAITELVRLGANVNIADLNGETPLMWAASWSHFVAVRVLIEFGAIVTPRVFEILLARPVKAVITDLLRDLVTTHYNIIAGNPALIAQLAARLGEHPDVIHQRAVDLRHGQLQLLNHMFPLVIANLIVEHVGPAPAPVVVAPAAAPAPIAIPQAPMFNFQNIRNRFLASPVPLMMLALAYCMTFTPVGGGASQ